jgi:hypothetical protein
MYILTQAEKDSVVKELQLMDNNKIITLSQASYYALYNPDRMNKLLGDNGYTKDMIDIFPQYAQLAIGVAKSRGIDTSMIENNIKQMVIKNKADAAANPLMKASEAELQYAASLAALGKANKKAMLKKVLIVLAIGAAAYFGWKYFVKK